MSETDPGAGRGGDGEDLLPGVLSSWRQAYVLVIAVLAADVAFLWLLGWNFR